MAETVASTQQVYTATIDEDHLLFVAEILALHYVGTMIGSCASSSATRYIALNAAVLLRESLRELLREALRYPSFRSRFNEHFSTHPVSAIREIAWPWMGEQLIWES